MANRHWTDSELIERLYGLGPDDGHLDGCAECRARLDGLSERKAELAGAMPEAELSRLTAQRRAVMAKIEREQSRSRKWWAAPLAAGAMAAALSLGVFWPREAAVPPAQETVEISDAQLFDDAAALARGGEAVATVQQLFEETSAQ
jgi:hypothetical protein